MAPAPSEPRSAHVHGDRGRPPTAQEAQRVAIRPYPVSRHQATRSADGVDTTVPGEASTRTPRARTRQVTRRPLSRTVHETSPAEPRGPRGPLRPAGPAGPPGPGEPSGPTDPAPGPLALAARRSATVSPNATTWVSAAGCSGARSSRRRHVRRAVHLADRAVGERERGNTPRRSGGRLRRRQEHAEPSPAGAVTLQKRTSPAPSSTRGRAGGSPFPTIAAGRNRRSAEFARRGGSAEKLSPASARTAFWEE